MESGERHHHKTMTAITFFAAWAPQRRPIHHLRRPIHHTPPRHLEQLLWTSLGVEVVHVEHVHPWWTSIHLRVCVVDVITPLEKCGRFDFGTDTARTRSLKLLRPIEHMPDLRQTMIGRQQSHICQVQEMVCTSSVVVERARKPAQPRD